MPSPVGHALGGAIVALGLLPKRAQLPLRDIAVSVVVACAPDVDFLWGRHGMETHSVGAAILAGAVVWALTRRPRLALVCVVAWLSHVLFDWLGSDDFPPIGVMALWPFTRNFYFANAFLFDTISRRYWLPGFWSHNIAAVLKEIAWLTPPTLLLAWWRWNLEIRNALRKVRRP
ncbi:MAG TPA: metal-dependent hydrolase [Vicinamibacterales bacterium]|nr:metal-dependent hydrolase [Vicinamibacterales bacterium]